MSKLKKFKWRKLGFLFGPDFPLAPAWMHTHAQTPSTLLMGDRLRIFFCTRPPADAAGQFVSLIGFVDVDPENIFRIIAVSQKPVLDLGGRGTFDEFGTNPVSVGRFNGEIKLYYAGWTRCESVPFNAAIGVAVSSDGGESFRRIGPGPVLSYSPDEPFVIGSPKVRNFGGTFYLHYASGHNWLDSSGRPEPVYRLRFATSSNGLEWKKAGRDILSPVLGENECQAGGDIFEFEGRYHMFFSFRQALDFKNKARGYRIGYAVSEDLVNWVRSDECAGIDVSPEGWDSEMVSYAHVFKLNQKLYMLYQGNNMGAEGFGLAVLDS
jgi:predicted GH43/DUF377 family glycosyl hydrolase